MGLLRILWDSWLWLVTVTVVGLVIVTALGAGASVVGVDLGRDPIDEQATESALREQVNDVRQDHGLPKVTRAPEAHTTAKQHSTTMADTGTVAHTLNGSTANDRLRAAGCLPGAENVGQIAAHDRVRLPNGTSAEANSATAVATILMTLWLDSPGHRENILDDDWRRVGIGVRVANGNVYATQVFCG